MATNKNVYTIDASAIDADGTNVPTDLEGEVAAYAFTDAHVRSDWAIKVVNDTDEDVDAQPLVLTSDDHAFEAYAEDGPPETATSGDVPGNVLYISGETVAKYLGVELSADPAPTSGTVTVVFNSRRRG